MNGGAYILVVIGILVAKCLGFLRDIVFASVFGASEYTDIYFQIFSLASLIFTGIGAALSILIIKNLNKPENAGEERQKAYVSYFITKTALCVLAATALLYVFAGPIVRLLLPGLRPELYPTALQIMYIMLPSCLFVIIAYILSGVLQNSKVFFITSLMSLPYNILIIGALLVKEMDIVTVSILTTIGWFLHIAVLLPNFYRKGFRLFGSVKLKNRTGEKNREVLYIFISSMLFQLMFMIDKASVSADSGAASTVNYASNLFVAIASVFVVAMSNVTYPSICRHYEEKNTEYVRKILQYIIVVLCAIFIPFILTVTCFGRDIISLLYQRGEFTETLSNETALLFCIYTFSIFGYVCQELFNKVLYLASKYKYTVIGTICIVLLKPLINIWLVPFGGAVSVALSTTVLFTLYAVLILWAMHRTIGNFADKNLWIHLAKILLAGVCAVAVYLLSTQINLPLSDSKFGFVIPFAACALAYGVVLVLTGTLKYLIHPKKITTNP